MYNITNQSKNVNNNLEINIINNYVSQMPASPWATNKLGSMCHRYKKEALQLKYVQHNPENSISWLVFDMDQNNSAAIFIERDLPAPNIITINKENGHSHYFYGLKTPIHKNHNSSLKAINYAENVKTNLRTALGADPAYVGLISKNPLHEHWLTITPSAELYELSELEVHGARGGVRWGVKSCCYELEGRNCTLLAEVRKSLLTHARGTGYKLQAHDLEGTALEYLHDRNRQLSPGPLSNNEIKAIAKSACKFVARNASAQGFARWGNNRRAKSLKIRQGKAGKRREELKNLIEQDPTKSNRALALALGCAEATIRRDRIELERAGQIVRKPGKRRPLVGWFYNPPAQWRQHRAKLVLLPSPILYNAYTNAKNKENQQKRAGNPPAGQMAKITASQSQARTPKSGRRKRSRAVRWPRAPAR